MSAHGADDEDEGKEVNMRFNITFLIRGPAATLEASNRSNPVECANLASLLALLAQNLPNNPSLGLETIGINVEPAEESAS
jgi:hypothetical protein